MTRAKRDRQKANRDSSGRHTGGDHRPGERCPVCKPLPMTGEQRTEQQIRRNQEQAEQQHRNQGVNIREAMVQFHAAALNRMLPPSSRGRRLLQDRYGRRGNR